MQRSQVFKVKGMQRDLSMANTDGEFAYEIVNMRLLPAEENSGLSLTNEQGTLCVIKDEYYEDGTLKTEGIHGEVLGQCPTSDSLVVFTHEEVVLENNDIQNVDRIYKISYNGTTWLNVPLYKGNLNFQSTAKIEAIFNYETSDIQKVYWIDGINQLRCINLEDYEKVTWNDSSFDSVKQIDSLPTVEIERTTGGSFVAGVLQYYISYFTEFGSESPIVYTSPLLYLAHENRGGNVNDPVSTAFKLTLSNLDTANWDSIRIYATHRTSLDATPEGSIIQELKIPAKGTIEVIDYGLNRVSIAPNDLYFIGGKFVKAGTMTVKDQVMFLGNLDIETPNTIKYEDIKSLFGDFRESEEIDKFFSTETRKQIPNNLQEYQDTYYTYSNQLNNTESITHYKYGEKYRFGISVMDKYGVWSNPIWIKDEFILTPPEQINGEILELPCPTLNLSGVLDDGSTLWEKLQSYGAVSIKPLVVFPSEEERKIIAQGVVCPTVYNLKDRTENGPYAQASWFMRPNAPADLWGIRSSIFGKGEQTIASLASNNIFKASISHKSDVMIFDSTNTAGPNQNEKYEYIKISNNSAGYYGAANRDILENNMSGYDYLYDDFSANTVLVDKDDREEITYRDISNWNSTVTLFTFTEDGVAKVSGSTLTDIDDQDQQNTYKKGSWVEFRHNYALRSKGWSFGLPSDNAWQNDYFNKYTESDKDEFPIYYNTGMVRGAELDTSRFDVIPPVNRFTRNEQYDSTGIELTKEYVKDHSKKLYFLTIEDPKTVHEKRQAEEDVYILVVFVHTENTLEYVHIIDTIKIPFKATIGTLPTVYGSPNVFINISNKILDPYADKHKKFLKLKARADSSITSFKNGERNYYVWEIRGASGIKLDDYIDNYMKETTMYFLNSESQNLFFGKKPASNFSLGNASYYVDNSIITLNSPEIELNNFSLNTSSSKFRITGLIPLTATSSDISLEVEAPSLDPFSLGAGLIKRTYSNTNIGYHGFKGIVSSNAYLTSVNGDTNYSLVPLHPWQTTGTLGKHDNTDPDTFKTKDLLKKKILSNLRYSAATYFFNPNSLQFKDVKSTNNKATLKEKIIGWKPYSSCDVQVFNSEDTSTIIKLNSLNYTTQSLVYKGNIDSIAMLVRGNTNTPFENPMYSFKDNPLATNTDLDPAVRMNSPAVGAYSKKEGKGFYKEAQGASIKYKSSPHFVIGFSCLEPLWGSSQRIQETLPAWRYLNEEGISDIRYEASLEYGQLYEDANVASLYHQDYIYLNYNASMNTKDSIYNLFRKTTVFDKEIATPNYGWLWLGEIYRETDPTFGGTSEFSLIQNQWETGGISSKTIVRSFNNVILENIESNLFYADGDLEKLYYNVEYDGGSLSFYRKNEVFDEIFNILDTNYLDTLTLYLFSDTTESSIQTVELEIFKTYKDQESQSNNINVTRNVIIEVEKLEDNNISIIIDFPEELYDDLGYSTIKFTAISKSIIDNIKESVTLYWTIGDTYYQRFDTLKTYAHDDAAQNSIVDITSFMVETRINIDGRYDRNRGQESNLQMSPNNFNLLNDIYSQKDNFFTYRILDDDIQNRTNFKNQITWSLSKTAGETIDSWLNVTLATVLDLDGSKGDLTALKTFGNNIVAFQDSGISQILFNSRVQIPTSENVPIQIANSGKVDGQQFITTDIGCQDKWNIVTTSQGLYFIDYRDKSIYKFNGQLANLSAAGGFRGWCDKHITDQSTIVGYYDIKNKEVMFYDSTFRTESIAGPVWLGFSEMSNHFSSFYTYPEAYLTRVLGTPVWLHNNSVFEHQAGDYNDLLGRNGIYGLTINTRQDSNLVKTFNTVEFRADTYIDKTASTPEVNATFDTIQIEDEHDGKTVDTLSFNQYRPSNLKKYLRTWRAQIPRVDNKYNRYVNQWAKIGLWKRDPNKEKTILHDMAVWYSE